MSDKLRNPIAIILLALATITSYIFILMSPFDLVTKLFLIATILLLLSGLFSYYWVIFLFIFIRPLIDFTAPVQILTIFNLSLNLPTLVGGCVFLYSLVIVSENWKKFHEKKIFFAWLLFMAWSLFSLLYTFDLGATIKELIKFANFFLAFLLGYILIKNSKQLTTIIKLIIYSSLLPAFIALYQLITSTGLADMDRNRLFGTFTHPNMLAFYLLLPITLSIFIFLNIKKDRVESYGYLLISIFLVLILFFTYTRGAYIALFLIFFIIGLLKFRKFLVASCVFVALIYALVLPLQNRVNSLFNASSDGSIGWRLDMWKDGLTYFEAKPVIGYGFGLAEEIFTKNSVFAETSPDPHNDYLRLALDSGIIGLSLYLILILTLLYCLICQYRQEKRPRVHMLNLFILALAIAINTLNFGDNLLNDTALQWNFWLLVGGLMSIQAIDSKEKKKPSRN